MTNLKLGLIGIVHEDAKKDFWGTMQRVAEIGYQGIEGAAELLDGDVRSNVARFHELGLQVVTHSVNKEQLRNEKELDQVIRQALSLRTKDITYWWDVADSREQLFRDAE